MLNKLVQLINTCLQKNIPFVSYRLPGEQQIITWIQRSGKINMFEKIGQVIDHPGFVYAPFHRQTNYPVVFFEPELIIYNDDFESELLKSIDEQAPLYKNDNLALPVPTPKSSYIEQANRFIGSFSKAFPKAVLSRVQVVDRPRNFDAGTFFIALRNHYPNAFCHLIHIPGNGTWAGATPEMLMRTDEKFVKTVSLAGTLPREGFGKNFTWQQKELEEQRYVIDYMEQLMDEFGINKYKKTGTESIAAGDMVHLSTEIRFKRKAIKGRLGEFLERLHPTPAVCGLPQMDALKLILDTEKHNREYYSGYCGPVNFLNKTDLFVNLRCMKIWPSALALFAGGGLTAQSIPEKEWNETELKANTLLKLL